jgi:ATP-dependent RNA helicase SUPV3L1/SUV3
MVEGHHVGSLTGFCFTHDPQAAGEEAKTLNAAAQKALASEIEARAKRVHEAVDEAFVLANDGIIRWLGEPVGRISAGDHILKPRAKIIADESLSGPQLEIVQTRLDLWLAQHVKKYLGSLEELETGEGLEGVARGIAFQIGESLGVLERSRVAEEMKTLPQDARGALRKLGVRFGAYHLYLPALLKPAPRSLAAQLWALQHGGLETVKGIDEVAHLASSGRTSFAADAQVNRGLYRAAGFRVCGERAVRVDILERLADLIRPAIAYRPGVTVGEPPAGAADGEGFVVTVAMTSLAGCSGESFASILKSLGYANEQRPGPAITVAIIPKAATEPAKPVTTEPEVAETPAAETAEAADAEAPATEAAEITEAAPEAPVEAVAEEVLGEAVEVPVEAQAPVAVEASAEAAVEVAAEPQAVEVETPEAEAPASVETAPFETPIESGGTEEQSEAAPATEGEEAEALAEDTAQALAEPLSVGGETEAGEEAAPAEAEVVLIEIWRPQRHPHGRGRQERGQERSQERGAGDQQHRRHGPRRSPQGAPRPVEGAAPVEGQAPPQEAGAVPEKRPFDRPRRDDRRPEGGKPRFEGKRPEGKREPRVFDIKFDGKRRDDQRRDERPVAEKPPRREKVADPDSPFAKLAALKAELEARNKKG